MFQLLQTKKSVPIAIACLIIASCMHRPASGDPATDNTPIEIKTVSASDFHFSRAYAALTACNAVFEAKRSLDEVFQYELSGIFEEYRSSLPDPKEFVVDSGNKTISIPITNRLLRHAVWDEHFGCRLTPPFADQGVLVEARKTRASALSSEPVAIAEESNDALAEIADRVLRSDHYGQNRTTTSFIVAANDRVLIQRFGAGFNGHVPQRVWSIGKSFAASLVGAAIKQGHLSSTSETVRTLFPTPGDPRGDITLHHLLTMTSGLDHGVFGDRHDELYYGGELVENHITLAPLADEPGRRWFYAGHDTLMIMEILSHQFETQAEFNDWIHHTAIDMGLYDTTFAADWSGAYLTAAQTWSSPHDLVRFGQFLLEDGRSALPEGWTEYLATPGPSQPPSNLPNGVPLPGYGAQFWIIGERFGLPADTYAAFGRRGQYVVIIPSKSLVIVRTGLDDTSNPNFSYNIVGLVRDVLQAVG